MSEALLLWGRSAVGKTTLELNLRRAFGLPLITSNSWSFSIRGGRRVCFVGKTQRRARPPRLLSHGGAESMRPSHYRNAPGAEVYVMTLAAGVNTPSIQEGTRFLRNLDTKALFLYSSDRSGNQARRVELVHRREAAHVPKDEDAFDGPVPDAPCDVLGIYNLALEFDAAFDRALEMLSLDVPRAFAPDPLIMEALL